jgi:hypothetical protein
MSFRGIVESPQYSQERDAIGPSVERLDEALVGVLWALSHDPEHFELIPGTRNLHRVLTDPFPDVPALRIWYSFDQQQVTLHSIEIADEEVTDEADT